MKRVIEKYRQAGFEPKPAEALKLPQTISG
jgi:hypothetical protein